jgi:uncharacterized protein
MSHNLNVEVIRNVYEAFEKGDTAVLEEIFADDIEFHVPGRHPLAGDFHSKEQVFEFFGRLADRTERTFSVDVHEIMGSGKWVTALVTVRGQRPGKTLAAHEAHAWRVVGDKAAEFWSLTADQYAEDDFWS